MNPTRSLNIKSIFNFSDRRKAAAAEAHRRSRNRLKLSPQAEFLEQKLVLTDPGMPLTTLVKEEMAMGFLAEFEKHHTPAALTKKMSDRNYFVVARDFNTTDNLAPIWTDSRNWLKYTYDTTSSSYLISPYNSVPITGDDVRVPAGLSMIYDVTAAPVSVGSSQLDPARDMRIHTLDVSGTLKFKEMQSNLMVVETLFVGGGHDGHSTSGAMDHGMLEIMEPTRDYVDRIVIAAPDWGAFVQGDPANIAGLSMAPGKAFNKYLDPNQFGRGLLAHGMVEMEGAEVSPYVTINGGISRTANYDPNKVYDETVTTSSTVNGVTTTTVSPLKGAAFIDVNSMDIMNWRTGDRIIIGGTDPNAVNAATGKSSDEEGLIKEITDLGGGRSRVYFRVSVVTGTSTTNPLKPAVEIRGQLQLDHLTPIDPATGLPFSGLGVQVANVSRNVILQSENPYQIMARGHVMFMHTTDVHVCGVGFYGLGRTDKRTVIDDPQFYTQALIDAQRSTNTLLDPNAMPGDLIPGTGLNPRARYAVHFHRAGIDETDPLRPVVTADHPAHICESAVVDSPGWGIVNHSSYVNVDNNVAFNVLGSSFVTEAGNELGRFVGNLAIKGVGANTSEGIESRKFKQDFGFQGDGFWFQGPGVDVRDNIAVSQRHDGFVFFTVGLEQTYTYIKRDAAGNPVDSTGKVTTDPMMYVYETKKLPAAFYSNMLTQMVADPSAAPATAAYANGKYTSAVVAAVGGANKMVPVGNLPILRFLNNKSYASGTGFESWFHQLNVNASTMPDSVIEGFTSFNQRGSAMFDPYTNNATVKNSTLLGRVGIYDKRTVDPNDPTKTIVVTYVPDPRYPTRTAPVRQPGFNYSGTAMARNSVTANFNYENVVIRGYDVGIDMPVNGNNVVTGGTFQNSQNMVIATANSRTRSVMIQDGTSSPVDFVELTDRIDKNLSRMNLRLNTNYDPKDRDITKMFNPDVINIGTVWLNSFELTGLTNQVKQLYYYEQQAGFTPFGDNQINSRTLQPVLDASGNPIPRIYDGVVKDQYGNISDYTGVEVPPELRNKTNTQLMDQYGLSIGGVIAPANAKDGWGSYSRTLPNGTVVTESPRINGMMGDPSTYQISVDLTSSKYSSALPTTTTTGNVTTVTNNYQYSFRSAKDAANSAYDNFTLKNGNLDGASGYKQLDLTVNGVPVPKVTVPSGLTASQITTFNNTVVKLPIRKGWNLISGNLDSSGKARSLMVYGDTQGPDLNLTTPDPYQLRRQTTDANGVVNGYNNGVWTKNFVGVMHPNDLDIGFFVKGMVVDNSWGARSYNNTFTSAQFKDSTGKYKITEDTSAGILDYNNYKLQKTNQTFDPSKTLKFRLDPISWTVSDWAGNKTTFTMTIYLDESAPRTGGSAAATGTTTPSATLISLLDQYIILDDDLKKLLGLA
jgi:hypothetical protein